MTANSLTSDERVEQIRQRHLRTDCYKSQMRADIDFLLSLIDSQAADDDISHCALCEDPSFIYQDCVIAAATQMRDKCVEKMREVLRPYELEFRRKTNSQTNIVDYAVMVLESLTLDTEKAQ